VLYRERIAGWLQAGLSARSRARRRRGEALGIVEYNFSTVISVARDANSQRQGEKSAQPFKPYAKEFTKLAACYQIRWPMNSSPMAAILY